MIRIITGLILFGTIGLSAQNVDPYIIDALRYSNTNGTNHIRSMTFGVSYNGVLNDQGAMYTNPAGMTLSDKNEMSFGLDFKNNTSDGIYLNELHRSRENSVNLSNIGISGPVKMDYRNTDDMSTIWFGIGYNVIDNYNRISEIKGFNQENSFIYEESLKESEWLKKVRLENDEYYTPITDSLEQSARTFESGGMHNIVLALAGELNDVFSLGAKLNLNVGNYSYRRELREIDIYDKYDNFKENRPYEDFNNLKDILKYEHQVAGANFNVGMMADFSIFRAGVSLQTPTIYTIQESYSRDITVVYDYNVNDEFNYNTSYSDNEFKISTPWKFAGGISGHLLGLTVSTGIEYTDNSQIKFPEGPDESVEELSFEIPQILKGQVKWGFAAEYEIPVLPIVVRGSYERITSSYQGYFDLRHNLAAGAGFFISKGVRVDAMALYSLYDETKYLYDNQSFTLRNIPVVFGLGMTYRY